MSIPRRRQRTRVRRALAAVAIALVAQSPAEADTQPVVFTPTFSLDTLGLRAPRTGDAMVLAVIGKPGQEDQCHPLLAFLQLSDDGVIWRNVNAILIYQARPFRWSRQDIYPADPNALPPVPAICNILGGAELMAVSLPPIDRAYARLEINRQLVDLRFDPNSSPPDLSGATHRYTDEIPRNLQGRDCRGAVRRIGPTNAGTTRLWLERWDGRAWITKETANVSAIRRSLTKRCGKKSENALFRIGTPGAWFHFVAPK